MTPRPDDLDGLEDLDADLLGVDPATGAGGGRVAVFGAPAPVPPPPTNGRKAGNARRPDLDSPFLDFFEGEEPDSPPAAGPVSPPPAGTTNRVTPPFSTAPRQAGDRAAEQATGGAPRTTG
ncbi:hypothetical protein, partial [Luedemannella flava]|uniref:hypothetical protein n=1 Tax=Luedemannella flava TaxID=349316 RepID=UPI0031DA5475